MHGSVWLYIDEGDGVSAVRFCAHFKHSFKFTTEHALKDKGPTQIYPSHQISS